MKKIFTFVACVALSASMFAQEAEEAPKAWKFDGTVGLNAGR